MADLTPEQVEVFSAYLRDSPWDKSRPEVGLPFEPTTDDDYSLWGRWVENLCLAFGSTFETAARVAALFVQGVRKERTSPARDPATEPLLRKVKDA